MKHIQKQNSPQFFEDWKVANEVETPEKAALKIWDKLQNPEKEQLRIHLLKEQGYLCCYCNQAIKNDPLRTKIEHLYPKDKEKYPERKFTYDNIMLACNGGERDKPVVQHCDTKKGNNEPTAIHPLKSNCAELFLYNALGEIDEISDEAHTTISDLGLYIDKLNTLRKIAIDTFIEEHLSKTDEDIAFELQLLVTKIEEKFSPFCTAVYQFIKNNYT